MAMKDFLDFVEILERLEFGVARIEDRDFVLEEDPLPMRGRMAPMAPRDRLDLAIESFDFLDRVFLEVLEFLELFLEFFSLFEGESISV